MPSDAERLAGVGVAVAAVGLTTAASFYASRPGPKRWTRWLFVGGAAAAYGAYSLATWLEDQKNEAARGGDVRDALETREKETHVGAVSSADVPSSSDEILRVADPEPPARRSQMDQLLDAVADGYDDDLDADFDHAAKFMASTTDLRLTNDQKLRVYALFKQATFGRCDQPKPRLLDGFARHAKWTAWNELGELSRDDAKEAYVELVAELRRGMEADEGGDGDDGDGTAGDGTAGDGEGDALGGLGGPVFSRPRMPFDVGDAEGDAEGGAEDPHGAWCKGVPVGELAAIDAAANKRRDGKKLTAKGREKAVAAATKEADACRAKASEQRDKWADGKRRRELFQRTWLALLRSPFPDDIYRKILVRAHADVMPHMPSPVTLSDFFTASIDRGGLDGMLALNGIFHLMTKHQLEYPKFYDRLYGLLDSSCFRAANRRGFFELLDVFLKSPALPAYLAGAFIKRLSRLAIHAPPAGAVLAVAYCHNLLRRHPGCGVMVHRENGKCTESDPFVADEPDPASCRALESSIWEMEAMSRHYHAQVSKFSEVLKKDLNDRVKTAEIPVKDICEANYGSLISEELRARVKTAPMASMLGGYRGLFRDAVTAECLGGSVRWAAETE